jgi:hypothetical protein
MEKKKDITVYHLRMRNWVYNEWNEQCMQKDYYFGSISAIYEKFKAKDIGMAAQSLYNFDFKKHPFFQNDKCFIKKSVLITKPHTKTSSL